MTLLELAYAVGILMAGISLLFWCWCSRQDRRISYVEAIAREATETCPVHSFDSHTQDMVYNVETDLRALQRKVQFLSKQSRQNADTITTLETSITEQKDE